MEFTFDVLLIVFVVTIIAETYGSIFGGGGFIMVPAFIALGIPPHIAIANDSVATIGTALGGIAAFRRKNLLRVEIVKWWAPGLVVGTVLGATLLVNTPAHFMTGFVAVISILGSLFILFNTNKNLGLHNKKLPRYWREISVVCSFFFGLYWGFSSAGAGTVSSLILVGLLGFSTKSAIGTRKILHLIPIVVAGVSYAYFDLLYWQLLLAIFMGCLIGGYVGGSLAIRCPEKMLRLLFFGTAVAMAGWLVIKSFNAIS